MNTTTEITVEQITKLVNELAKTEYQRGFADGIIQNQETILDSRTCYNCRYNNPLSSRICKQCWGHNKWVARRGI